MSEFGDGYQAGLRIADERLTKALREIVQAADTSNQLIGNSEHGTMVCIPIAVINHARAAIDAQPAEVKP